MSHFTTVQTRFTSEKHLLEALADVRVEFKLGPTRLNELVKGFKGQTAPAQIVVATGHRGYDLGFRSEGGIYHLVADWFGIHSFKEEQLLGRLQQRYAYHATREQLEQQGFALVEEKLQQDQSLRLVLRRLR